MVEKERKGRAARGKGRILDHRERETERWEVKRVSCDRRGKKRKASFKGTNFIPKFLSTEGIERKIISLFGSYVGTYTYLPCFIPTKP